MKKNDKGFMLTETLIVIAVVVSTLIYLYTQIVTINNSYDRVFKYNTVNGLYYSKNIRDFLLSDNIELIKSKIDSSVYIELTECPSEYISNVSYCTMLFDTLDVNTVIMIGNISQFLDLNIDEDMRKFLNSIETDDNYNLIVKYDDESYSTIKVGI